MGDEVSEGLKLIHPIQLARTLKDQENQQNRKPGLPTPCTIRRVDVSHDTREHRKIAGCLLCLCVCVS